MKTAITILLLTAFMFLMTGCANLSEVLAVMERTEQDFQAMGAELRTGLDKADSAREDLQQAIDSGNMDTIKSASETLKQIESQNELRQIRFSESEKAFKTAADELKRGQEQNTYFEAIAGLVLGGLFGGGGGFLTGRRKPKLEAPKG